MIDNYIRERLPALVQPLISLYQKYGLTPNQVSVIGFVFALFSALLVSQGFCLSAACIWWIGRIFDGTDGILARQTGQASDFGAHLDILLDMASYSIVIVGFLWLYPGMSMTWMVILVLYVLCITGALSLGALEEKRQNTSQDNRGLRLASGLAEAGETGIAYTVFLLFPHWVHITSSIWIGILLLTVFSRYKLARQVLT